MLSDNYTEQEELYKTKVYWYIKKILEGQWVEVGNYKIMKKGIKLRRQVI